MRMVVRLVALLVRRVHQQEFLQAVEQDEAHHQSHHGTVGVKLVFAGQLEDLGQHLEAHHPQQHPGGETQHIVQIVFELQRQQATGQGGRERGKGEEQG